MKIETSRSSSSAFILSPQGSEAPLLESVLGVKPWFGSGISQVLLERVVKST